ncbi:hypothetical protein [Bradyrhizobium elkanii]
MTKYSTLYFEEQAARKKTQRELEEVNQKLEEADRKLAQMREFIRETGQSGTFLLWLAPKYGIDLKELDLPVPTHVDT